MDNFDRFLRNENMWFKAAVGAAVIVFATVVIGTVVSLATANGSEERGQSIDVVYKLGLIGAGLITFCTVAWRGLIATQQSEMQRLQIDKLSQQIAATEENNLAELLQKGAQLIDEDDKNGHVMAGIATLQSVATAANDKFAIEAMNVLADYIQTKFAKSHKGIRCAAAVMALDAAARIGRKCERALTFEGPDYSSKNDENVSNWLPVSGVLQVRYIGGTADPDILFMDAPGGTAMWFEGVNFSLGTVPVLDFRFSDCTFEYVRFASITVSATDHKFKTCDFSGCTFQSGYELGEIHRKGNFFDPQNPPVANNVNEQDWGRYLQKVLAKNMLF